MTKWIIVSDNHTEQGVLFDVINHHEDADVALHLGDSEFAYDDSELSHFHRVKGNTDFSPEFPNEEKIEKMAFMLSPRMVIYIALIVQE